MKGYGAEPVIAAKCTQAAPAMARTRWA